jgi:hypothetical protein
MFVQIGNGSSRMFLAGIRHFIFHGISQTVNEKPEQSTDAVYRQIAINNDVTKAR